jgi:hypothetical protein
MPRYIENLNECTDPVSGDFMWLVDASAGSTDKDRKVDVGKFARLAVSAPFTANVSLTTAGATLILTSTSTAGISQVRLAAHDAGTQTGNYVFLGNNSNATTPAAGLLYMLNRAGTAYCVWVDASGNLRIGTTAPTNANDGTGTVVGAQTSHRDYKELTGAPVSDKTALAFVLDAADQVQRFTYKSGAFNGEEFSGVILDGDTLHRYGQDADAEHPAGKSLNTINAIGDLFLAVRALTNRIGALEDKAHE